MYVLLLMLTQRKYMLLLYTLLYCRMITLGLVNTDEKSVVFYDISRDIIVPSHEPVSLKQRAKLVDTNLFQDK